MISVIVIACFGAGVICLLYALLERWRATMDLRRMEAPADFPSAAPLFVAVMLLALAAAVAVIDDKVASAGSQAAAPTAPGRSAAAIAEPAPRDESVLTYPMSDGDMESFAGTTKGTARSLRAPLCLVQYYNRDVPLGEQRSYKWWTSCGEAKEFETIGEVRAELALPPAWGERNAMAVACVPEGAALAYVNGKAAAVQSKGKRFRGGGVQYRVLRFDTDWIVSQRRLPTAGAPLPALDPQPCEP